MLLQALHCPHGHGTDRVRHSPNSARPATVSVPRATRCGSPLPAGRLLSRSRTRRTTPEGREGNARQWQACHRPASAYSAFKAGVIGLTKSLGKELARHGILVNCLTPAAVETDLFQQMTPAHIQYMLSRIPMRRFGQPTEIAALVVWLASEECSFSTGGVFDISGGRATY